MAAPADVSMSTLSGEWELDAKLSDPTNAILGLQGIGWALRKVLSHATVTLHVHEYRDPEISTVYHIDTKQVTTGGIEGNTEQLTLDWKEREHIDNMFGLLNIRSRFIQGETLMNGSPSTGFVAGNDGAEVGEGGGLLMQSFAKNSKAEWTAEQVWGFEVVNGERRHTHRVVVAKNGKVEMARLVYNFKTGNRKT
ncbi:hypothetical protein N7523_000063 [Penicillium sp. IBT 18751x]|nr:hypothetical protein N7523_000063 [Penicillium sp. IBT 18751x]